MTILYIKGNVNRWFVYRNKKKYCFYLFPLLLMTIFCHQCFSWNRFIVCIKFFSSFFFREGKLTVIMNANFFFQCILNVGISPSRSISSKRKNLVKEKKNQNEFRLNDFRNKKKVSYDLIKANQFPTSK